MSTTFFILLLGVSLLGALFHFVWGFLGLVAFSAVSNPREREAFGRVAFWAFTLFCLVLGSLLGYYWCGGLFLGSAVVLALGPYLLLFYIIKMRREV